MKTILLVVIAALTAAGCHSSRPTVANPALKSERQYAENSEARAQELARTGQTSSIADARAQAAAEANNEWASAAKASEANRKQQAFEKDLAQSRQPAQ